MYGEFVVLGEDVFGDDGGDLWVVGGGHVGVPAALGTAHDGQFVDGEFVKTPRDNVLKVEDFSGTHVEDEAFGVALATNTEADGEVALLGVLLSTVEHAGFVAGVAVAVGEEDGGPTVLWGITFGRERGGI